MISKHSSSCALPSFVALPSEASGLKVPEEALTIVAVDDQDGDDIEVHDTSGGDFSASY